MSAGANRSEPVHASSPLRQADAAATALSPRKAFIQAVFKGGAYYYFTTLIVILGLTVIAEPLRSASTSPLVRHGFSRFDGGDSDSYLKIAESGYSHAPYTLSTTAFFPGYPLLGRALSEVTGWDTALCLVLIAHLSLAGTFITLLSYLRCVRSDAPTALQNYVLLALGLFPTTFFFRIALSEALLLFLIALVLYGMRRRWPLIVLAVLVGLTTAARPVGIALVPPFALYVWRSCVQGHTLEVGLASRYLKANRLVRGAALTLVSSWGLLGYMAFQWIAFGDAMAFASSQRLCRLTFAPPLELHRELFAIATLEPIWSVYVPSRMEHWASYESHANPLLSLQFANPIYFVGTGVLVFVGWRKGWLDQYETLLSAGLLLIPYVTKSYDNAMASFGRFSAVVLPAYIVMGHLLYRLPRPIAVTLLAISAVFLGVYSAMFAAGYRFI